MEEQLSDIREDYYSTTSNKRREQLKRKYSELVEQELTLFGESRRTTQLKTFQPFVANSQASFFDPQSMFGISKFDIVIGNPPYVRIQNLGQVVSKELSENYFEMRLGKTKSWVDDLYAHFIFRGFELANEKGIVCMITNDSFIALESKLRVRAKLLEENLIELIRCPKETFGATIYTAIFLASRAKIENEVYKAARFTFPDFLITDQATVRKDYIRKLPHLKFAYEENELMGKLVSLPTIGEYIKVVPTGINTGNVRDKMFFREPKKEAKDKLIQGRQIQRWAVYWDSPAAKYKYCNPKYEPKDEFGTGRSGKKSNLKEYWFYARGGDVSYHFLPERILLRTTSDSLFGAYQSIKDDGQMYTDHSLFTVVLKDSGLNLKYFLGILNSKLLNYIYQYLTLEEGKIFAEVKMDMVEQLPIVYDAKRAVKLVELVESLIDKRRLNPMSDVANLENELNELVCEIYGLSEAEKELVLGNSIVDQLDEVEEDADD